MLAALRGVHAQVTDASLVARNSPVAFDSIVTDDSDGIYYIPGSGVFTFANPGNYIVTWQLSLHANSECVMSFGLKVGGRIVASVQNYMASGQLIGSALVHVENSGESMQLVNTGTCSVSFPDALNVRGNIVVTQISN